jgi:thiamine-monophosphate kinase
MAETLADLGETGWIRALLDAVEPATDPALHIPIGDDAAVWIPPPGKQLILTCDAMVEGTHFRSETLDWHGFPRRALLAAASDVAAMGGIPYGFLLSLGAPPATPVPDLRRFVGSLAALLREHGLMLLGGDTVRSDHLFLDVTCIGTVDPDRVQRQTGGQPGDALWVTGSLGGMVPMWSRTEKTEQLEMAIRARFWNPPARWTVLDVLFDQVPIRAMTDLSDGLAVDLRKILQGSDLGAEIELDRLPVDPLARDFAHLEGLDPSAVAFTGGEDFELLVVEEGSTHRGEVLDLAGVPLTRIGRLTAEAGKFTFLREGNPAQAPALPGFEHF